MLDTGTGSKREQFLAAATTTSCAIIILNEMFRFPDFNSHRLQDILSIWSKIMGHIIGREGRDHPVIGRQNVRLDAGVGDEDIHQSVGAVGSSLRDGERFVNRREHESLEEDPGRTGQGDRDQEQDDNGNDRRNTFSFHGESPEGAIADGNWERIGGPVFA